MGKQYHLPLLSLNLGTFFFFYHAEPRQHKPGQEGILSNLLKTRQMIITKSNCLHEKQMNIRADKCRRHDIIKYL